MTLKAKLDEARAASAKRIPPDKQAIMKRGTDELRASGILAKVAAVGQTAPVFEGTSHNGASIRSGDLLARGPLVMSFFRGHW